MRKIAMVGTTSTGAKAPFGDLSWEIWGVSMRANYVTRADRWYEIHRLDGEPPEWANQWRAMLRDFIGDINLVMMYPEKDLAKNITVYPYQRIIERFGGYFMTSTFSWMMAQAIDELRPVNGEVVEGEIAIYGVDMEYGTEYRQQRAGFNHFIHLAKALGIAVTRLADGGLAYDPIPYPMWQDDPLLSKLALRMGGVERNLKEFDDRRLATQTMMAQCEAIINVIDRSQAVPRFDWAQHRVTQEKRLKALTETSSAISRDIVDLEGQLKEQRWLNDYLQP